VTKVPEEITFDPRVAVVRTHISDYAEPLSASDDEIRSALRRIARLLGWTGGGDKGAFANVVPRGARVLVKPNLVMHENLGPWGMKPLVTHGSLISAAVEEALRSGAAEVMVGDAPLQACDFAEMTRRMGLDSWAEEFAQQEPRFKGVRDFRRTVSTVVSGVRVAAEDLQPADRFVLFDLGSESLLEPITDDRGRFRVTCYDPRLLARTHAPGRHQYLVAREVIEADVVINLPKLKTHKKAGLTCALKNLIGINGNKEFLPHHRVGGPHRGGDCYDGGGILKGALEHLADRQNTAGTRTSARLWHGLSVPIDRALRMLGEDAEIEGAWSGNDTIWRSVTRSNAGYCTSWTPSSQGRAMGRSRRSHSRWDFCSRARTQPPLIGQARTCLAMTPRRFQLRARRSADSAGRSQRSQAARCASRATSVRGAPTKCFPGRAPGASPTPRAGATRSHAQRPLRKTQERKPSRLETQSPSNH